MSEREDLSNLPKDPQFLQELHRGLKKEACALKQQLDSKYEQINAVERKLNRERRIARET